MFHYPLNIIHILHGLCDYSARCMRENKIIEISNLELCYTDAHKCSNDV